MCKLSPCCLPRLQHYTKTLFNIYTTIDAVKEQRNTPSEVEVALDHDHKENLLYLSTTTKRANQKPISADKKIKFVSAGQYQGNE